MEIYIVQPGDTVDSIAWSQGVPVDTILYNNQISYPYRLAVGQALLLNKGSSPDQRHTISAGGYAYPFIQPYVLEQTLPYLNELYIFSYGFDTQGNLIPPALYPQRLVQTAQALRSAPILTLTPLGPDGQFNNYLITTLVNNSSAEENLLTQLFQTMEQQGYSGIDVDFEFILPEDRVPFAQFVERLRQAASWRGYTVSVALAPKTSDDQRGLLYEGKDYGLLGAAADWVLLMTYEWGYSYGPPMAVAPLPQVRQVLEYGLTRIPPEKINLGIPNYGYDWTLPFIQGQSKARTIGNLEAVQIAIDHNASIQFDPISMSPYFYYYQDGRQHQVWFEDVRSLRAKYTLVSEYQLRGIGCWQIMKLFRAGWLLLADTFWLKKNP